MTNNAVLVADDLEINREMLGALFEDKYEVLQASKPREAMRIIEERRDDLAIVLLDLRMPNKEDGFDVLDFMRFNRIKKDIPVILITAEEPLTSKAESKTPEIVALAKGADDFIQKPYNSTVVKQRVENLIELYRYKRSLEKMIQEQTSRFRDVSDFVIDVLMSVMQAKNSDSRTSILRIRSYTRVLLEFLSETGSYELGTDEIELISTASVLHDIGEVAVPEELFAKQPYLSREEQKILESHTEKGVEIIRSLEGMGHEGYIKTAIEICRWHHERYDGSGYPDHLVGDDIPLSAQVVGLSDTYEGLRAGTLTGRSYTHDEALLTIENGDFGSFSPVLTESCKIIGEEFSRIHDQFAEA